MKKFLLNPLTIVWLAMLLAACALVFYWVDTKKTWTLYKVDIEAKPVVQERIKRYSTHERCVEKRERYILKHKIDTGRVYVMCLYTRPPK